MKPYINFLFFISVTSTVYCRFVEHGQGCDVNNGGCEQICDCKQSQVQCNCVPGFVLNNDEKTCSDIDECAQGSQKVCQDKCVNTLGSYFCTCTSGVLLNHGKSCSQGFSCAINNGGCEQICLDDGGTVKCECREGFHMANEKCFECGINMKKSLFRRIVGGKPADPKDWPWMAALLRKSGNQFCGGTLITNRHVLTAAHCVIQFTKNDIKVRLGEYSFDTPDENNPTDFSVEEMRSHENYDSVTNENDIAIIKLDKTTSFTEFIKPACLPPPNDKFENHLGFVIGWGAIYYGGPYSNVLLEVVLPIWNQSECKTLYPENTDPENMFCAGIKEGGEDSCQGDSGGPFVVQIYPSPRWYVAGIVSWGIECAIANRPGVYTRVNRYLDWIKANAIL